MHFWLGGLPAQKRHSDACGVRFLVCLALISCSAFLVIRLGKVGKRYEVSHKNFWATFVPEWHFCEGGFEERTWVE